MKLGFFPQAAKGWGPVYSVRALSKEDLCVLS
jgi:hypothetical protein